VRETTWARLRIWVSLAREGKKNKGKIPKKTTQNRK
jgi:hypothetical protein